MTAMVDEATTPAFDRLIAPMSFQTFLQEYKSQKFAYFGGDHDRWSIMVTHDELNNVLSRVAVTPGSVHLLRPGSEIPPAEYLWAPFIDGARKAFRPDVLEQELRRGATLHLRQSETLFPGVHAVTQMLATTFMARVSASLFLVSCASMPSGVHWDDHDMLVFQVAGRKKWPVYKPLYDHPLYDPNRRYLVDVEQVAEIIMSPGDVLYIPRGWPHNPEGIDGGSLHVACAVITPTGSSLLESMIADLRRTAGCVRMDVPLLSSKETKRAYAAKLREAVSEALTDKAIERYYQKHQLSIYSRAVSVPRVD
jgi:ribosomal protein L16 Arg81 hydroxylase